MPTLLYLVWLLVIVQKHTQIGGTENVEKKQNKESVLTMTLNIANQFFFMTLKLMFMHHHTKFGNKMYGGSEDVIWPNIH